jgi:hypothetical protein
MAAPAEQTTQDGLGRAAIIVPALAGAAVGRAREEAGGIWRDARALAGRPAAEAAATVETPAAGTSSDDRVYFAWYGGLTAMAALRLIEWRLAAVIAAAHTVERYGHRRRVQDFVEGLGAGL